MSVEAAQKKQRKKIVKEKKGQLVRAEEIQNTQAENEVETTHRVGDLHKYLQQAKSVDYFLFVLDQESFGQTVENIFHAAFLVRDGLASLSPGEDGKGIKIGNIYCFCICLY